MNYGSATGIDVRSTGDITHEGMPARIVSSRRFYDIPAQTLWKALTDPDRLPRWFLPINGDLRINGHYQLEGHASGKITQCDPPHALDLTWEHGENISWLRLSLESEGHRTKLTLHHIMLKDEAGEAHWKTSGPGATGVGWELAFLALDYHLSNGGAMIDPKENEAWTISDAGKTFIRDSAKKWGEAHIVSGELETAARMAAETTTRFYTGEAI